MTGTRLNPPSATLASTFSLYVPASDAAKGLVDGVVVVHVKR